MAVLVAAGDKAAGDDAAAFSSAASSHGMASSSSGGAAVPAIDAMASSTAIGHRAQVRPADQLRCLTAAVRIPHAFCTRLW